MKNVYFGGWNDSKDMASDFQIDISELKGKKILYAMREYGDYDGWCIVIFREAGKLYEVVGSHCSCFGLEDQWCPVETSKDALRKTNPDAASFVFGAVKKK